MYFCLKCNRVHEEKIKSEKIFSSGYTLINSHKVPLGLCAMGKDHREERYFVSSGLSRSAAAFSF